MDDPSSALALKSVPHSSHAYPKLALVTYA